MHAFFSLSLSLIRRVLLPPLSLSLPLSHVPRKSEKSSNPEKPNRNTQSKKLEMKKGEEP